MARIQDPITIGKIELRNRAAVAPALTMLASPKDGYVTDRLLDRYEHLTRGGWGLICVEVSYVRFDGNLFRNKLSIESDFHVSGLAELASVIKMGGAKASIQIMHGGRQAIFRAATWGYEAIAPSATPLFGITPREMTTEEAEKLIDIFATRAGWAKEAGYDAVTVHGANGFLPQQFMSPATNKRKDKFGDRMLWPTELARRIKSATGADFPLIWRFSADEFMGDRGITLEMTQKEIVPALEGAGVDCLDVSAGSLDAPHMVIPTSYQPRGCLIYLSRAVKEVAHVPVIGVGNINDPQMARDFVENGQCDIVAFARASIADPHFARKMLAGRDEEVRRCIACYKCLDRGGYVQQRIRCSVNPTFGNEKRSEITPAPKQKKVVVVGGGPGGMQAGITAAQRGHQVTLYEKQKQLGGQLLLAVVPPGKETIKPLIPYLSAQLEKAGVSIKLGAEATPSLISSEKPDAVVLATGGTPLIPDFCYSDIKKGQTYSNVVTAFDVLSGAVPVGDKVAIIGGDLVACETADFLAQAGKKVTITKSALYWKGGPDIGACYGMVLKPLVLGRLSAKGVEMIPGVIYEGISDKGMKVTIDGKGKTIEAETIVVAAGLQPNRKLYDELKSLFEELYMVGDCVNPNDILDAIHQGFFVGKGI
jgi:2,4-dienoyl-CoA reductase-like NADH-dependent reductase (Old Yellow Enzyme family)/thioredoxin reductase